MSESSSRRVAIIGGGLSGLATAVQLRLADPTSDVTLFEASPRLGGVINTEHVDGFLIDHGADMFATQPSAALDLCQRLGVADQLIEPQLQRRGASIVHRGRLVKIPDGFVLMRATKLWPMMTTPLLSPAGKLRFLLERWIRPSAQPEQDESVAQFVRRRLGSEVLERIVGPLAAGIYTADIERLSMLATMGPIAAMERSHGSLAAATAARKRSGEDHIERTSTGARYGQFRAFRGGMRQLIDTLVSALPADSIRTGCPIRSITPGPSGWTLTTDQDESLAFEQVVVTTPPAATARLLDQIAPVAAQQLQSIESASTAIVMLGVHRSDIRDEIQTFGFVVPQREQRQILAGSFASYKFAGRASGGDVLIRVFIGGATQPELLQHSDQALIDIARRELAQLIGLSGQPKLARVIRWDQAMPQYHVGHRQRVAQIEQAIADLPGLFVVSNALHGVGIAPVIQAAGRVAEQIQQTSLAASSEDN